MSGEIYAAMAKAMAEIGTIGKTRKNAQQGYEFRGIDDVIAHVQPVFAAHGIVVVPEVLEREREMVPTKSGGVIASVRLLVRHTFYAKDGSFVHATTLGEAMDSGDKSSNKAMSAALKYALTEGLLIPTYEADRDTEEASPQMAATNPTPRPSAKLAPNEVRATRETIAARSKSGHDRTFVMPFANKKNEQLHQLTDKNLAWFQNALETSIGDPEKSRFVDSNKNLLARIDAEMALRGAQANGADEPPPLDDKDLPF